MSEKPEMADLVKRLVELLRRDIAFGKPKLFPAAAPADIRAMETALKRQLPPSYVEFLRVTNGMTGYQGLFTLVGASGAHSAKAQKDIDKRRKFLAEDWEKEHGTVSPESVAAFESKMDLTKRTDEEAHIFAGNKLIFGTDYLGSLLFFLEPTGKASEPRVIWRDNQGGIVTYDSFREMLTRRIKVLETRAQTSGR